MSPVCPGCGRELGGHFSVSGENITPRNGDPCLCAHCATLAIFQDDTFRYPTEEEFKELMAAPEIQRAVVALRVAQQAFPDITA